ncbi:MAG: hypothetical protein HY291_04790 [Planctomycetes bacterium]|nr:hypothetical protein [Planctomycetota bacterium]
MATTAWVCFDCRVALRRPCGYYRREVLCTLCRQPCINISYKIPIPPKQKKRQWAALFEQLMRQKREQIVSTQQAKMRRKRALIQEIARLESMPANEGRKKAIRLLHKN